jgi:hypothetical protein
MTPQEKQQLTSLQREFDQLKRSSTFPYVIQKALEERTRTVFSATKTIDFASTLTQTRTDNTITVRGAVIGDLVALGIPNAAIVAGGSWFAWVSAADTVTIRYENSTAGTLDPGEGIFKVAVIKTT